MADITLSSPSGRYQLDLNYAGEVHFGPLYFSVTAKGFSLDPKLSPITEDIQWSPSEKYLGLVVIKSIGQELESELNVVSLSSGIGSLIETRKGQIDIKSVDDRGGIEYTIRLSGKQVLKRA